MKRFLTIVLFGVATVVFSGTAYSEEEIKAQGHQNLGYQIMKIKHRAELGFTNNGRVQYQYTSNANARKASTNDIGTLVVKEGSRLREVHNAVDLRGPHTFGYNGSEPLNIGSVIDNGGNLKRVETRVRITGAVKH